MYNPKKSYVCARPARRTIVLSGFRGIDPEQKRAALMPAVGVIASVQACEALKIAAGKKCALQGKLFCADLLNSEFECIPFS